MNSTIILVAVMGVIIGASLLGMSSQQPSAQVVAQNPAPLPSAGKTVQLGLRNYNFYFPETQSSTLRVQKGQSVTMQALLDGSDRLSGCYKSLSTPWGSKVFRAGDTQFTFTPTQAGTFGFTCGMGMGRGTIVVE